MTAQVGDKPDLGVVLNADVEVVVKSDDPCPVCADNDDPDVIPLHINCRCKKAVVNISHHIG